MHSTDLFYYQEHYKLESGKVLAGFHLQYSIYGTPNESGNNVIWIVHALTANDNPIDWWPGIVGEGLVIDPAAHCIICVNNPGSPYGSISPLTVDITTDEPYYHDFPILTTRDIAGMFSILRKSLQFNDIQVLIGASMGGQIAMEWAIIEPSAFNHLLLLATNAFHSPWGIAFNESQRLAIEADHTFTERRPDAGYKGLKAARSIALLSYRTAFGYNATQNDKEDKIDAFKASSYQQYQGDKLVQRFNAFSYYSLTKTMDSHNVGRNRKSIKDALASIMADTMIVGINTDLLFPITEQAFLAQHIIRAKFIEISSDLGHDGFLTETEKVGNIIRSVLLSSKGKNNHSTLLDNHSLALSQ